MAWKQRLFYSRTMSKAVAKANANSLEKYDEQLESNFHTTNKVFWQTIRQLRGEEKGSGRVLKDKSGHPLTEVEDIIPR
ncbi:unnamed protein product [Soboliphyme baturini]|uniref:RGS domain-containing protein n=1 Tax=Soboliphyme baturini TaxID=241478 RepID=A0A183IT01_9BILA|nr:unnamed protein product [Soboliphyme baturini]